MGLIPGLEFACSVVSAHPDENPCGRAQGDHGHDPGKRKSALKPCSENRGISLCSLSFLFYEGKSLLMILHHSFH